MATQQYIGPYSPEYYKQTSQPKVTTSPFPTMGGQTGPWSPEYMSANLSAVSPTLKTPAAQTYIQNQATPPPVPTSTPAPITAQNTMSATPTGPSAYDTAKADYTKAYQDYINTLNPSSDLTNAQGAYNQFIADKNVALQNISDKTIPMRFITGQQKSVESRAQIEAGRLQGDISLAQQRDEAKQKAGLANVDFRQKLLDLEESPAEQAKFALEQQKAEADINLTKAQTENIGREFEENKRQFGLEYALAQQRLDLDRYKADLDAVKSTASTNQLASQSIGLVNNLLQNTRGSSSSISGIQNPLNFLFGGSFSGNAQSINEYNQLKAQLALGSRSLLKGSGAISDYESKILDASTSSLGRNLSDAQFQSALKSIRGVLKTNSGLPTTVQVYSPATGETIRGDFTGDEIFNLVSEGNTIKYE